MNRSILSITFPYFSAEMTQRRCEALSPLAMTDRRKGQLEIIGICPQAHGQGLAAGMSLSDARAILPTLRTAPYDPRRDQWSLGVILRALRRFTPTIGFDGPCGLVLDLTGVAHLFGGHARLIRRLRQGLGDHGLTTRMAMAGNRAAARALAIHAPVGPMVVTDDTHLREAIGSLPVAALEASDILPDVIQSLGALGLKRLEDVLTLPRASLARRFGLALIAALDRMTGQAPDPFETLPEPFPLAARMRLPEPVGLVKDVVGIAERLALQVCKRLEEGGKGARRVRLRCSRVDHVDLAAEVGFTRPMREVSRMLALLTPQIEKLDAGFGFDAFRFEALDVEEVHPLQAETDGRALEGRLDDVLTSLGNRLGFERLVRFQPVASHIPERSFTCVPVNDSAPCPSWPEQASPRPVRLITPEKLVCQVQKPELTHKQGPALSGFRWRGQEFSVVAMRGPERIAPEWWHHDPVWQSGARDYWHVETRQGRQFWLFTAAQAEGWWMAGAFA